MPRKPAAGESLADLFPTLAAQWHESLNGALSAGEVLPGSHYQAWWRCPVADDHVWKASVKHRALMRRGCPCCANRKVSVTNSLANVRPELAAQWDRDRNGDLRPEGIVWGSNVSVHWICGREHRWEAMVSQRTMVRGTGCPYCSRHRFVPGESFADLFPVAAASWDTDRNLPKRPGDFSPHSNEKVWWTCERGHSWETTIDKRAQGQGCPRCTSKSSAPEIRIFCELRPFFPDVRHRHRLDGLGLEVDIYVPSIVLVIQYDSVYFHARRVDADARMSQEILDAGHGLIRLRDERLPDIPGALRIREKPISLSRRWP